MNPLTPPQEQIDPNFLRGQFVSLGCYQFSFKNIVGEHVLKFAINPDIELEQCALGLSMTMIQRIFGEQVKLKDVTYPKDWWEAFKERWFPEWAKEKWPVEYTVEFIDARFLYPSVNSPDHEAIFYSESGKK